VSATPKPPIGSRVIINPAVDADQRYSGVVFTVIEHLRTYVLVQDVPSAGRKVRVKPAHLLPAPDTGGLPAVAIVEEYQPPLPVGAVFTVTGGALGCLDETALLVVIGVNGLAYKAALLGGNNDRYWPKVARAAMRPVDMAPVLPHLKALLAD
jgi:hypothetical protein